MSACFRRCRGLFFDPDLVTGQDKDFFIRARDAGISTALAQRSIVLRGHGDRDTTFNVLKRGFVNGRGRTARAVKGAPERRRRAGLLGKSVLKLALGLFISPVLLPFPYRFMRKIYFICRNAGLISVDCRAVLPGS